MKKYNPAEIEPKWQQIWEDTKLYKVSEDPKQPKQYVLDFFPYPSGAGLSVGHVRNYTMSDVYPRLKRMQGYNVLHPMGWDAFGLPAENFAIQEKISPRLATDRNKANYKRQMQMLGLSYDWDREIDSTDPDYYKWTQWFFLLLFKRGLAYQADSEQWWCETDKTVLANEQVEGGKCWRCGNAVTKKRLNQWFFKITEYADRLLNDLAELDWPEGIKQQQINWIGRSEGARISFEVKSPKVKSIDVFTTRADTLGGATFLVLAPEHPLVADLTVDAHMSKVESYIAKVQSASEIERQETDRPKTGVDTGATAVNPITGEQIPIWISDYVLLGYGTGAIMAVPAHDQRDWDFANQFNLPIRRVIEPKFIATTGDSAVVTGQEFIKRDAICAIIRNPKTDKYLCISWKQFPMNGLVTGGVETGEDPVKTALREIHEETGYKNLKLVDDPNLYIHSLFYHRQKQQNRWARFHFLFFDLVNEDQDEVAKAEAALLDAVWKSKDELLNFFTVVEGKFIVDRLLDPNFPHTEDGILTNSKDYDGLESSEARAKIIADLAAGGTAKATTSYKLRDWLISRQRYWGAPIPIIHCPKCGAQPVPEAELPVVLPEVESYEPSGDGRSPLANIDSFVNVKCPECHGPAKRETDTLDGFACSSWYFLRFASPNESQQAFDPSAVKYWLPVDMYIGGAEHAVLHLLYARFWTKVMKDAGLIDFGEPFKSLRNQGMILASGGQKMSKSKGNVITPDEIINEGFGADALRLFEMFIAPYDQAVPWQQEGLSGTSRFLHRVWVLVIEYQNHEPKDQGLGAGDSVRATAIETLSSKTIRKVTHDIENFAFNTAVAALMEMVNELYRIKSDLAPAKGNPSWDEAIATLLKLLSPFAPHITEELWQTIGAKESIHIQSWPEYDPNKLKAEFLDIVVQINGKLRGVIALATDDAHDEAKMKQAATDLLSQKLAESKVLNTIVVAGKLVNFVTDQNN